MKRIPLFLFIVVSFLRGALLEASIKNFIKVEPKYLELLCIDFNKPDTIIKKNKFSVFYEELRANGYLYKNKMWYIISPLASGRNDLQKLLQERGEITQEDRIRGAVERNTRFNIPDFLYFVRFDKRSQNIIEKALESNGGSFTGSWDVIQVDGPSDLWLRKTEHGFYDLFLENLTAAHYEWDD